MASTPLATPLSGLTGIARPTADQVIQYGVQPHGQLPETACHVHRGLHTLVSALVTDDGAPVEALKGLPDVVSMGQAGEALKLVAPKAVRRGTHVPWFAGFMKMYSKGEPIGIRMLWMFAADIARVQGLQLRLGDYQGNALGHDGCDLMARIGRGSWYVEENVGKMPAQRIPRSEFDRIFRQRDDDLGRTGGGVLLAAVKS